MNCFSFKSWKFYSK